MSRDATAFSLLDALSETGFQSSVIATFCCYFPFYEEVVLRRLLDRGCTNNVLMVDASLCAEAFANEDTRPRRAGRDYTLVPVNLQGAFHPKLIVTLGKAKGALFVGSHNTTVAGFGLNDEVTNVFRTSGAGARQGAGVIRAALDYLQEFAPVGLTDVAHVFGAVRRNVPWLDGPVAVESNERVFLTTTGSDTDLWSRIRPLAPKRPTTVFVCGPFFDGKLAFLRRIVEDVKPRRLVVGIDPESVEIDPVAVRKFREAEFVNVSGIPRVPKGVTLSLPPGPGLILIVGRNGSGKSSFAEGLELLLTGRNLRWEKPRAKVWQEGWRNLHHAGQVSLNADLLVEGKGSLAASRVWASNDIGKSQASVTTKGP